MILKDDPKAYAIMGCAMRVHSILGYGFLESAYGQIKTSAQTVESESSPRSFDNSAER